MIRIFGSWKEWPGLPEGWRPASPPGAATKHPVHNTGLRKLLRAALPGRWMKVYHRGADRSELHYFQHESGRIAFPKLKHKP